MKSKLKKNKRFILFLFIFVFILAAFRTFAFDNIVVIGESMQPTFYNGDVIIIRKFNLNTIEPNDIIVANVDGNIIVKRILDVIYIDGIRNFFIIGDNYFSSYDSRNFGFIDSTKIIGVAVLQVFPFGNFRHNFKI